MRIPPEMMTQRSLRFFHMVCLPSTNSYFFVGGIRFTPSAGEMGGLPYAPETFDLITCTNALHYVAEPGRALAGLRRLLTLEGQLVLEDFARRTSPFPWAAFEWLMKQIDAQYVRAYTLKEAQALCSQAGLDVVCGNVFSVDWLWHGWVLRAYRASSGSSRCVATASISFPRP